MTVDTPATTLDDWIPRDREIAIIDAPVHRNAGDLFIYAVTAWLLEQAGNQIVYRAGVRDYRTASARRRVGRDTVIVGLGGGNFGDMYPPYQALREQVAADFAAQTIVVFPQTIHYGSGAAEQASVARLRRHPDLRIAARDRRSLAVARAITDHAALLPDVVDAAGSLMLEALGRLPVRDEPSLAGDTLYLMRRDDESAVKENVEVASRDGGPSGRGSTARTTRTDWLRLYPDAAVRLVAAAAFMPIAPPALNQRLHRTWQAYAGRLFVRTANDLRRFDRIVTDRLHGAILARIAGRPVTLVDNSYGKLASYYDTWWRGAPDVDVVWSPGATEK